MIFDIFLVLLSVSTCFGNDYELSDDFIEYLNSAQSEWVAGRNFAENTTLGQLKRLTGTIIDNNRSFTEIKHFDINIDLPENFDAREKWSHCKSLTDIRDQGQCGSCWAVSTTSAMSDRVCIFSKGEKQTMVSAIDVITCNFDEVNDGCHGGSPYSANEYWISNGIVDGGDYGSENTCRPYPFPHCSVNKDGKYKWCTEEFLPTPPCEKKCQNGLEYSKQKSYGEKAYRLSSNENAMKEIFVNGPITATFRVYADLIHYKNGVYSHISGRFLAGHAVRVVGWGVENGVKYWLVTNSWNEYWGDKGCFKIKRGVNECKFEENLLAVTPKL